MIHHISMSAKNPQHVANVLAEIAGGQVVPAPPNFPEGSRFVLTGDEYGTLFETLPYETEMRPDDTEAGFHTDNSPSSAYVAMHAYISVPAGREQILKIGEREGWLTRVCDRGPFELIECWIENRQLIEFATPEMKEQYVNLLTNPKALQAAMADLNEAK
ncbi:MAG TPA: hypothetical protein PLQ88_15360 [Blastocatellia bacterium]|nr:hypothetical protein [Blastocatellia bacterium]